MSSTETEQQEKAKEMVASMQKASANMRAALDRIDKLEQALKSASIELDGAANYVGDRVYIFESRQTVKRYLQEQAEKARSVL